MKYEVDITRTCLSSRTLIVEADNEKEAEKKAIEKAWGINTWEEDFVEYEVDGIYE